MCIRDSWGPHLVFCNLTRHTGAEVEALLPVLLGFVQSAYLCLLYTSDAADERSSVDLGGRRIIKKKNNVKVIIERITHNTQDTQEYDKQAVDT